LEQNSILGPLPLLDKKGRGFFISKADLSYLKPLLEMYSCFYPRPGPQGLPPSGDNECAMWVKDLLIKGINLVAVTEKGKIIGHCALLPAKSFHEAEYMIFVHQDHRNAGIGTLLTQKAKEIAEEKGIKMLWLCVSSINIPAIKLYLKTGFSFKLRTREECFMYLRL